MKMKARQFIHGYLPDFKPIAQFLDLIFKENRTLLEQTIPFAINPGRLALNNLGIKLKAGGIIMLLGLAALTGCGGPRSYLHPKADFTFIKKVAVLPFENFSNDKFAGDKIRDIVITEVLSRGFFDVVEWGEVSRVLREEGNGVTTALNKETAKRVGSRLGIQALLLGSVEEYGTPQGRGRSEPQVAISMRMIDVRSSKILWQASFDEKGSGTINQLFGVGGKSISKIARGLVREMMGTLFGSSRKKTVEVNKQEKKVEK